MKMRGLLLAGVVAVMVTAPAFAQSDATSALLQGLQNWNNGSAATGTTPQLPTSLDALKTTALAKASLAAIDTNRNGTVSKEELAAMTNKMFDLADSDHNGQLTEAELTTFAANMNKVLAYLR